jgi:leucyl aminopeptidase (aminopeptidase T)
MSLKPGESCLIVTDSIKEPIGRAFYEYAGTITENARIMLMRPGFEHAEEPPERIAKVMLEYDVQLLITDKSLTHTKARINATARGARIASMPMITEEIANRCLDIDYDDLRERARKLYLLMKNAREIKVTTVSGTDMKFTPGNSDFFGQNGGSFHSPGSYGNLPEGEISFAPETCEGVFVVDASFPGLGLLSSPLTFYVENGRVTRIEGERSQEVINRLDEAGPKAYIVAELGIGLNPKAKVTGNILEDEKVIGTSHIAVGNNLSYGRDNDVQLHLDGVIRTPSVYIDDNMIMEKGKFADIF